MNYNLFNPSENKGTYISHEGVCRAFWKLRVPQTQRFVSVLPFMVLVQKQTSISFSFAFVLAETIKVKTKNSRSGLLWFLC
jgi:hypothetical protein